MEKTISADAALDRINDLREQTERIENTLTKSAFATFDKNEWCPQGQNLLKNAYEDALSMVTKMRRMLMQGGDFDENHKPSASGG